jgi:capsular polysaccharide biosynthesis protein
MVRRMRRHMWWGLIGVAIASALVWGYAFLVFQPPYESETVVFYQPDINPESLGQQQGRVDPTFMRELLLRRGRLEQLLDELDLHQSTIRKYGIGVAIQELQRMISFKPVGKSTFRISYIGDSPEQAQEVTAWLADQLVEEELDRRRQQALQSKAFLDKELERTTKELAEHEEKLGDFIARYPRFATTNNEAAREAARKAPAPDPAPRRRRRVVVRRRPGKAPPAPAPAPRPPPKPVEPDPALLAERDAAISELTRASRRLAELQSQYTDAHPEVGPAKARVAAAEDRVKKANDAIAAATAPADDIYDEAPAEDIYESPGKPAPAPVPTTERRVVVETTPDPAPKAEPEPDGEDLEDLPPEKLGEVETEWMRLKRAVEAARDRQSRLAAESFRAEVQSRSQSAGHSARVVILDKAYLPSQPLRSRLFFGKIWAPLVVLFSVVIVLGRALFDDTIYDTDDLVNVGMKPLLSVIPPHAAKDA